VTEGWFGAPLPHRSRQLIPEPVTPVMYETFDPEFLAWVRDRLRELWNDPSPETQVTDLDGGGNRHL
jgi:hypothetical protein